MSNTITIFANKLSYFNYFKRYTQELYKQYSCFPVCLQYLIHLTANVSRKTKFSIVRCQYVGCMKRAKEKSVRQVLWTYSTLNWKKSAGTSLNKKMNKMNIMDLWILNCNIERERIKSYLKLENLNKKNYFLNSVNTMKSSFRLLNFYTRSSDLSWLLSKLT